MPTARPTAFVVFTSPRSGSSWLVDLLDSHARIAAYAELFLPGDRTDVDYGCRDLPRFEATLSERRRITLGPARFGYLRRVFARRDGIDAVGFKLMYGHPHVHPGLLAYLAARRTRAIHLVRENTLAQIVSRETAIARGQFRAREGKDVTDVKVHLDIATLRPRIAERAEAVAKARDTLRRYRLPVHELTYERLKASPRDELAGIAAFLRVEPTEWPMHSSLLQMNRRTLRDVVENADKVERALAATGDA
jgi:LPS sulfotransferase NodH